MSKDSGPIDEVDDSELASIVSLTPSLPLTDSENSERFASEVRRIVESHAMKGWPSENGPSESAIFVLVDYPRRVATLLNASTVIDLPDVDLPLFGRIFFLSRDASNGGFIELPCGDNETLNWLEDNGFENCPVVIAHRGTMQMSIRRLGTAGDAIHEVIRDTAPSLSLEELQDALNYFHKDRLVSPTQCGTGIWESKRAHEYVPVKYAEKAIQRRMRDLLSGWFRGLVRVEPEDATPVGRIDIRLLAPSEGDAGLHYWAIVELKVARSHRNAPVGTSPSTVTNNENAVDIVDGIVQADSYRAIRDLNDGFLEVFDMRKDKGENLLKHSDVEKAIEKCVGVVHCRLRPMYGSAKEARTAGLLL